MTLRFRHALLAASVLGLAAPAGALADVTIEQAGGTLTVTSTTATSATGEASLRVNGAGDVFVYVDGFGTVTPGTCTPYGDEYDCGTGTTSVSLNFANTGGVDFYLPAGAIPDGAQATAFGGTSGANTMTVEKEAAYNVAFTGGAGKDFGNFGAGNDTFHGLGGDDTIRPSAGDDTFDGGAGNDTMETGTVADGADTFDGGADTGAASESRYTGDAITYSERTTAISATLPLTTSGLFSSGNGAPGEDDKLRGVETVEGGQGTNTLHGNDADNDLFGSALADTITGGDGNDFLYPGLGADTVSGDGGNDTIEARRDLGSTESDIDVSLDCGTGDDRIRRDQNDPTPTGCEHDTPGFVTNASTLAGNQNVGSTLTVTGLGVFADPGTTTTSFVSCADADYADCQDRTGTGNTYQPTDADLGRRIFATSYVQDAAGYGDRSQSALSGPIGARLPAPVVTPAPAPASVPVPIPAPSPAVIASAAAIKALGVGSTLVTSLILGDDVTAFTPKSVVKNTLPIGKTPVPVLAIVCTTSCVVQTTQVVTLPKSGKKPAKTFKLTSQKSTVVGGGAAVITVKTTAAQRKAIKAAKGPKVAVSVSVTKGGKTTKGKSTFKLKVTKP